MSPTGKDIAAEAEVLRLARLLDVDVATLGFLEGIEAGELRELRRLATDALFDADSATLARLAAAGKLLPTGLVAAISERAFGPLLAARVTSYMDPGRAADVGKHLDPTFLADICVQLDPRSAKKIIPRMELETVLAVTEELLERGDFVTLGRFVGTMPHDALGDVLEITEDDELLRICAVAESAAGIDEIFEMLSDERLEDIRRVAAGKGLKGEALVLRDRLSATS